MALIPIGQMRHRLQLKLYATLALAGLAVFAYGLVNLLPVMGITIWALTDAGTLAVSGHGTTGFDLPFVLATLLRTVMTTLGGGLFAWLAFRTWRRRRRAGRHPIRTASRSPCLAGWSPC